MDRSRHTTNDFRTDHLEKDLATRSVHGSVVTLAASATKLVTGVAATIVLARLLRPDDFGLTAIALATVDVLAKLKDAGLFTATVQRSEVTHEQATTLFWLSAMLASTAALLTLGAAPVMGWFYRDVRLVPITAALACVPLLDGMTLQLEAVMTRQMRFVALSVMDASALAVGVLTAFLLASAGAGYWALVGQEVVYSIAYACVIWVVCRWRPGRPSRRSGVRPLVAFGLHLSGFRILNHLAMNLDTVFVGRFWGPQQAGLYDRAYRIITTPSTVLNTPLSGVAVPALSRLQDNGERFRIFYLAWLQFVFALTMPLVAFLFVDAERAILTILGSQWIGVAPVLRVLAPAVFIGRFNVVTNWLYVTTGRTDRQLRWSAIVLAAMVVAYAIGVHWGAIGVAFAHTVVTCLLWYPSVAYCCRTGPVRPADVFRVMIVPSIASIAAGVGLFAMHTALPPQLGIAVAFLLDSLVYVALYLTGWIAIPTGRRKLVQLVGVAREMFSARPTASAGQPSFLR